MTEAIKIVTFVDIVFIIILVLSGMLPGLFGELIYYCAFLVPITIGFFSSKGLKLKREQLAGVAEPPESLLFFDKKRLAYLLPLIAPSILIIFLSSLVTSVLLSSFGVTAPPVEENGIVTMLIVHALAPALFEEALFRYVPMKLLLPYSRKWCVIYSALFFALIHCSFYQMPYAFLAGIIFMLIDIALGSVWPSVILHLINNSASVIWMKYCTELPLGICFISALVLLSLISLYFVLRKRKAYLEMLRGAFERGEAFKATYAPLALITISLYLAFYSLLK